MGEAAIFGVSALSQAGDAYAQNQALRGESDFERRMTNVNSGWAAMRAEDALKRGDFEAGQVNRYGSGVKSAQRAAMSGSPIDINTGSAAQIQAETDALTQLDVLAARNNAYKEMMGIQTQDMEARGSARMNRIARRNAGRQSIIRGGLAVAREGAIADYRYQRRNRTPSYSSRYDPYEDD